MQIKIKTDDMELEYQDDNSAIYEETKKRILDIVQEIRKRPTVSAYEALGIPNPRTLASESQTCGFCGANQLVRPNVMCTGKCDNKEMTQFIN
jgi:hypothetical protein